MNWPPPVGSFFGAYSAMIDWFITCPTVPKELNISDSNTCLCQQRDALQNHSQEPG